MASRHDQEFDPTKPALVLLYGNTSKKHRMLDRDAILIGRARGCDFGLDAPDISSVHCVINRIGGAFHLRDCQSRAGTKLNGNNVREANLRDGDLLQIGPFSFRVKLPSGAMADGPRPEGSRLQHLERSRRHLARIALRQRRVIRLHKAIDEDDTGKSGRGQLTQQLTTLKARVRDYDQRARALEDAERDIGQDREKLDREMAAFQAQTQAAEQELVKRRLEIEAAVEQQLEEPNRQLQQRQRDLDALARQLDFREQQLQTHAGSADEQQRQIVTQRQEITRQQQESIQQLEAFEREKKEFSMTRDQWARDQASILARLGQQKTTLAQVEEALREQRKDLDDVVAALQECRPLSEVEPSDELVQLRAENEQMRRLMADRPQQTGPTDEDLFRIKNENDELKQLIAILESERKQIDAVAATAQPDSAGEIAELRRLLKEKDAKLEELISRPAEPNIERDIDSFEAELNATQRQLETDRQKLSREIEQLRARNQELDEATREMELEMSRECAELGRERQRLDRIRDDVRLEMERMQRDAGLRDRLAPVQNLRDQMNHRGKPPSTDQTPKPATEDPMQARLQSLRNKISNH